MTITRESKADDPHLDFEMWETMNLNPPLFVLSNSRQVARP
jgi:hypothetical protein